MSELSERLKTISSGSKTPCPLGKILLDLDKETSEALQFALESRVATRIIHLELSGAGMKIGRDTITQHRNGWCRCGKGQ